MLLVGCWELCLPVPVLHWRICIFHLKRGKAESRGNIMEIISVSIGREELEGLEKVQERFGFKSRSKLMRAAIDSLLNDYAALESLSGHCDAVFTISSEQHSSRAFGSIMKEFGGIIKTEIHQHHARACLRVLIVCGNARRVKEFFIALKNEREIKSVNFAIL